MKYFKIGFIIFGICTFLYSSIDGYNRNVARLYNADFASVVIWVYLPISFFSTVRGWLAFSIFEMVLKMEIPKVDKSRYILFATLFPMMISFYFENFRNYAAILDNGWRGLIFYPFFLSNLYLIIFYLLMKNKPNECIDEPNSTDTRNSSSLFP